MPLRGTVGALLSLLASRLGSEVSIDAITSFLWDEPPPSARTAVQVAVHRLRRVLEPDRVSGDPPTVVVTTHRGYRLVLEPDAIDSALFEKHLLEGRRRVIGGSWKSGIEELEAAIELWRGVPFGEHADRPELLLEVNRLVELRLENEELLSEARITLGTASPAHLRKLAEGQPLRERRWRHLMLALYEEGRHAEALRAFGLAQRAFGEAGLDPSPDLYRLEERILLHDPGLVPARFGRVRLADPSREPELIGRHNELLGAVTEVARTPLVTITGPPGVGKSRLAVALAHEVDARRILVDVAKAEGELPRLLCERLGGDRGGPTGQTHSVAKLAAILGSDDVLLILDGLDRHIESARTLLEPLLALCPRLRVVVTSREPLHSGPEHVIRLQPLPVPSTIADDDPPGANAAVRLFVAEAARRGVDVSDRLGPVADLARALDGLPLALEIAAGLSDVLSPPEILHRLISGRHDSALSATVHQALGTLSESARDLIRTAACFRTAFTIDELEKLATRAGHPGEFPDDLIELTRKSMLQRESRVYRLIAPLRTEIVSRAAERYPGWSELRRLFRATIADIVLDAGTRLETRHYHDAVDTFDRLSADIHDALTEAIDHGEATTAWRILGGIWQYWWIRRATDQATDMADRVTAMNHTDLDWTTVVRGLNAAGVAGHSSATMADRKAHLTAAADLALTMGPGKVQSLALSNHAIASASIEPFDPSCVATAEIAHAMADAADEPYARTYALLAMGLVQRARLDLSESLRYLQRAAGSAEARGLGPLRAFAEMWTGHVAAHAEEHHRARSAYERAITCAEASGVMWVKHISQVGLAEANHALGQPSALQMYRDAAVELRSAGDLRGAAVATFRAASMEIDLGNLDRAERLLATAIPDLRQQRDTTAQASAIVTLASLDLARDDRDSAECHLSEAEELFAIGGMPPGPLTWSEMERLRLRLRLDDAS